MAYDTTSYQIIDSINTQSPSATQYSSEEAKGTLGKASYASPGVFTPGGLVNDGISQKNLYELLLQIHVNWDTAMINFDLDAGIDTATFAAGASIGNLESIYGITPNGISQPDLVTYFTAIETAIAACTALLDGDATLTDEDYASSLDVTLDTTQITGTGISSQGAVLTFLNDVVTSMNALWTKLDADIAG